MAPLAGFSFGWNPLSDLRIHSKEVLSVFDAVIATAFLLIAVAIPGTVAFVARWYRTHR